MNIQQKKSLSELQTTAEINNQEQRKGSYVHLSLL